MAKAKADRHLVGALEASKIMGVSRKTIYDWLDEGCPREEAFKLGKKVYQFDIGAMLKWHIDRERQKHLGDKEQISKEEAQRRKLMAEAELAELEVAKKKSLVVELGEVEDRLKDKFAELRSVMRKIPERCVLRIVGETDESVITSVILEEVDHALKGIADE